METWPVEHRVFVYNGSHFPFRRRAMDPRPPELSTCDFSFWWYLKSGVYAHNPRLGSFIQPFCLYVLCSYLSLYILTQFLSPLLPLFYSFVCGPAVHNPLNVSLKLFVLYLLYRNTFPSTQPLNKGLFKNMLVVLMETYCNKVGIQKTQRDDFVQIISAAFILVAQFFLMVLASYL